MSEHDFPDDLKKLQAELHSSYAEYRMLCRTLPWSTEPLSGWPGVKHPHTDEVTAGREDSPGYTPEQVAAEAQLWARIRELSIEVSTHPYWNTLERGPELVEARTALKHHADVLAVVNE
ncbi:hypothetical protein ACFC8F_03010 [Streptomyces hydrogenans]|uniref:hypothetical protein n=1 Tax=Streptomyces hydrogenans TaxID=1873719 RepID=UPI0035DC023A